MTFSHPLARGAKEFSARNLEGKEHTVLAIVTTLELDPKSHNYKKAQRMSSVNCTLTRGAPPARLSWSPTWTGRRTPSACACSTRTGARVHSATRGEQR